MSPWVPIAVLAGMLVGAGVTALAVGSVSIPLAEVGALLQRLHLQEDGGRPRRTPP